MREYHEAIKMIENLRYSYEEKMGKYYQNDVNQDTNSGIANTELKVIDSNWLARHCC